MDSANKRSNTYQQTAMFKFMRSIAESIDAIGEGMSKQHDENLTVKKKPSKETVQPIANHSIMIVEQGNLFQYKHVDNITWTKSKHYRPTRVLGGLDQRIDYSFTGKR